MDVKQEHKRILIEILDEFVRVCKENNLKYYLGYGTALGAVRHHGLIPWDDDIDVVMPRKDYNRLIEMGNSLFTGNYKLSYFGLTPNYYYDFVKIENTNTTLIERIDPLYVGSVYVDIFPIDNVPDKEADERMAISLNKLLKEYAKYYMYPLPKKFFLKWLVYKIGRCLYPIEKKLAQWENIASAYQNQETKYVCDCHTYIGRGFFPKEVYGEGVEMLFEGEKYMIPAQYEAYLKQYYGDYMTPPPVENRKSGHNFLYVNLEKRLSEEELRPIIKQLQTEYTYQFGIRREIKMIIKKIKEILKR